MQKIAKWQSALIRALCAGVHFWSSDPFDDPELDPLPVVLRIASKAVKPCGPIVMTTGLPSFVLACTTNASAMTLTLLKPALCSSLFSFWALMIEFDRACDGVALGAWRVWGFGFAVVAGL